MQAPLRGALTRASRLTVRIVTTALRLPGALLGGPNDEPSPADRVRSRPPPQPRPARAPQVAPVNRLELEIAGGTHAPGTARAAMRPPLAAALDEQRLDGALLLLSELVMNSVLHARADEQHPITVHLAVAPDRVRVEVCDHGSGFDPRDVRGEAGFGVLLLRRMSDRWGVARERGEGCVWFEIDRAGQQVTDGRAR